MSPRVIFALVLLGAVLSVRAEGWGYDEKHGPMSWSENYPECGGERQSPIAIEDVTNAKAPGLDLKWFNYDSTPKTMTLKNNGHSVALTHETEEDPPTLVAMDSRGKYLLDNVHFHWGKKGTEGSEHSLRGERYTMEMHAVHRKVDSDGNSVSPADFVVTVAFLTDSMFNWNPSGLKPITHPLGKVEETGTSTSVTPFRWSDLLRPFDSYYYWYKGSLTTPPCTEAVTFIFDPRIRHVSPKEMKMFRNLLNGEGKPMSGNFRPLQERNGRQIFYLKSKKGK